MDVPEEVSSQANGVADLVDLGGEVGEVIPEVKTSCLYFGYRLLFIISVFFSHVSHLSFCVLLRWRIRRQELWRQELW